MADDVPLLYRWRAALKRPGGPPAQVRYVCLLLGEHMDRDGNSCFPGQRLLADESGLSLRTINSSIGRAVKLGWVGRVIKSRWVDGRTIRTSYYSPAFPKSAHADIAHADIAPSPTAGNCEQPRAADQRANGAGEHANPASAHANHGIANVQGLLQSSSVSSSKESSGDFQSSPQSDSIKGRSRARVRTAKEILREPSEALIQRAQELGIERNDGESVEAWGVRVLKAALAHQRDRMAI